MIIKRSDLYDLAFSKCKGAYAVGLHGVDYGRVDDLINMDHDKVLDNILENGLKVFHARSINGTVKFFGRLDTLEDEDKVKKGLNDYWFMSDDYILVAIPVILKNSEGKTLFIGCPNLDTKYKNFLDSKGREMTTLLDENILDSNNVLNPEFILGSFRVLPSKEIDIKLNKKHVCYNDNIVDDDTFRKMEKSFDNELQYIFKVNSLEIDINEIKDTQNINHELLEKIIKIIEENDSGLHKNNIPICETLIQLSNEDRLTKKEEKLEVKNKGKAILNRGVYYASPDSYYVDFEYASKEEKIKIKNLFHRIVYRYGIKSDWAYEHKDCFYPYQIDNNGSLATNEYEVDAIGGTNIPQELMHDFIKNLVDECGITCVCQDISMDTFDEDIYDSMIKALGGKVKLDK